MDYNYDRIIITIAIICFALGAGAYYLYENNFNLISKIEKCADQRIPGANQKSKFLATDKNKKLNYQPQYPINLTLDYTEAWQSCEKQAKEFPIYFKTRF